MYLLSHALYILILFTLAVATQALYVRHALCYNYKNLALHSYSTRCKYLIGSSFNQLENRKDKATMANNGALTTIAPPLTALSQPVQIVNICSFMCASEVAGMVVVSLYNYMLLPARSAYNTCSLYMNVYT